MLLSLHIRNIALIEQLTIEFSKGLHALTGETGAGKSIVVDAMNLAIGERADRELIRTGTQKAGVDACFDVSGNRQLLAILEAQNIEPEEDGALIISRDITLSGKNTCRIGGVMVPLGVLRQVTSLLVDIHGQHEHQSLLDVARHRDFIDAMGSPEHAGLLDKVRAAYHEYRQASTALSEADKRARERERLVDMLSFQVSEIESAKLKPGEEDELARRRNINRNAEKIADALDKAYKLTYTGGERSPAALEVLKKAETLLDSISEYDESFKAAHQKFSDIYYALEDAVYELRDLYEAQQFDPGEAEEVEARLDIIRRMCRKYGATVEDVLAFYDDAKLKLDELADSEATLDRLTKQLAKCEAEFLELCAALTESRAQLSAKFAGEMLGQLSDLGMASTQFEVMLSKATPGQYGADHIEFLISPNPGEPLKPLARIASGGEMSRIMLSLKNISANAAEIPCVIFDEIDTGISGRMAQVVAEKMVNISNNRQVICVTHLPQIAAMADVHFLVEKHVVPVGDGQQLSLPIPEINVKTETSVTRLDEEGRVLEIARMIGGAESDGGETANDHARTMLKAAEIKKN